MILLSSVWIILAPIIAAQYLLAAITLFILNKRNLPLKSYIIWNIVILFVIFAGSIAFLICSAVSPSKKQ